MVFKRVLNLAQSVVQEGTLTLSVTSTWWSTYLFVGVSTAFELSSPTSFPRSLWWCPQANHQRWVKWHQSLIENCVYLPGHANKRLNTLMVFCVNTSWVMDMRRTERCVCLFDLPLGALLGNFSNSFSPWIKKCKIVNCALIASVRTKRDNLIWAIDFLL